MRRALAAAIMAAAILGVCSAPAPSAAQAALAYSGTQVVGTRLGYKALVERLLQAIEKHKLGVVGRFSATEAAASIGVKIPGNTVIMVFRPDYAVRMLRASVPAGIEAPLRFYVTENENGTATLTYRRPSSVFAPYGSPALDAMALALDRTFADIARDAAVP